MICRGIPGNCVENMQKTDGAMLIINILEKGEEAMAKYYDGCPRCGRRDFGEILHCKRCNTDFCTKCQGKRKLADGTEYACCPRCGAEIDDDDTVVVVTTEKENARNR